MSTDESMVMGKETEEIYEGAVYIGEKRLSKPVVETAISAFIAGIYVTFGGLAALTTTAIITDLVGHHDFGWLIGSMLYPIGFIFVVIGKSELFTENFVTPVLATWEGKGTQHQLFRLWGIALVFNVLGVLVITFIIGSTNFLSGESPARMHIVHEFQWVANHVFAESFWTFIWKSIFGGLLINFMSWLVIAVRGSGAKLFMIWLPTFLIMLLGAHHCIVGSSEILLGIYHGADTTFTQWFQHFFIPAAVGNAIGGVVFVAGLHYIQVYHSRLIRSSE